MGLPHGSRQASHSDQAAHKRPRVLVETSEALLPDRAREQAHRPPAGAAPRSEWQVLQVDGEASPVPTRSVVRAAEDDIDLLSPNDALDPKPASTRTAAPAESGQSERELILAEQRVENALTRADLRADWSLLQMHPECLAIQQDLLAAKTPERVLIVCSEDQVAKMDGINLATALYRIAKFEKGRRSSLPAYERFSNLMVAVSQQLQELDAHGLVNVFWSLGQLQLTPSWLPSLLCACREKHSSFSIRDVTAALGCLAKSHGLHSSAEADALQATLVEALAVRVHELDTPADLVCAAAGLSRLDIRHEQLFARIAERSIGTLAHFSMTDMTSLCWSFGNMNFTHGRLFAGIRRELEQRVEECSPRELVQISWTFSRLKKADEELFLDVVSPVLRARVMELEAPRDHCTLVWAFSNAAVLDAGLFGDVGHILASNVKLMDAHHVSTVVVAFSAIEYAHRGLFNALKKHTRGILSSFSMLQLSRAIYGFGVAGVHDEVLFRLLCEEVLVQQHQLQPKNIMEIMVGLAEADYTPGRVMKVLLRDPERLAKKLGAEDMIQTLHALSRVKIRSECCPSSVVDKLLGTVRRAVQGWWRYKAQDMADLLEALQGLGFADALLLESVGQQLPRVMRRENCPPGPLFLRLLGALAELPADGRGVVAEHLHRKPKLQAALEEQLAEALKHYDPEELQPRAQLLYACARLGYDGPAASVHCSKLTSALKACEPQEEIWQQTWWPHLLWALAEMQWHTEALQSWLPHVLAACEEHPTRGRISLTGILCLAWTCIIATGRVPAWLLEEVGTAAKSPTPFLADDYSLRQTATLAAALGGDTLGGAPRGEALAASETARPDEGMWARWDRPGQLEVSVDRLSGCLRKWQVPHVCQHAIDEAVSVPIAFPESMHALFLLGPRSLAVHSRRHRGTQVALKRHLEAAGWRCEELLLHDVQRAEAEGTLEQLALSLEAAASQVGGNSATPSGGSLQQADAASIAASAGC